MRLKHLRKVARVGGSGGTFGVWLGSSLRRSLVRPLSLGMHSRGRVWVRSMSSDLAVFKQIFVDDEYAPLRGVPAVQTILDLGANIGCSSVYFLEAFPSARVVAVEPDPANFRMLKRNLEVYRDRAVAIEAGVWNRCCELGIIESSYRDGADWSRQVQEVEGAGQGCVVGLDVPELMRRGGFERISILKIDIEGAEVKLFDASSVKWLEKVDNIAIELHDDSGFGMASPVFWQAMAGHGFIFSRSGELVIGRREGLAETPRPVPSVHR